MIGWKIETAWSSVASTNIGSISRSWGLQNDGINRLTGLISTNIHLSVSS